MISLVTRLFTRGEPTLSEASPQDARALAGLHAASFHRGWSDGEFEHLLLDRHVVAHRAMVGRSLVGFIMSRRVLEEAEILSVAVAASSRLMSAVITSDTSRSMCSDIVRAVLGLAVSLSTGTIGLRPTGTPGGTEVWRDVTREVQAEVHPIERNFFPVAGSRAFRVSPAANQTFSPS